MSKYCRRLECNICADHPLFFKKIAEILLFPQSENMTLDATELHSPSSMPNWRVRSLYRRHRSKYCIQHSPPYVKYLDPSLLKISYIITNIDLTRLGAMADYTANCSAQLLPQMCLDLLPLSPGKDSAHLCSSIAQSEISSFLLGCRVKELENKRDIGFLSVPQ